MMIIITHFRALSFIFLFVLCFLKQSADKKLIYKDSSTENRAPLNAMVKLRERVWKDATVYYNLDPVLAEDTDRMDALMIAIDEIQKYTCVAFKDKNQIQEQSLVETYVDIIADPTTTISDIGARYNGNHTELWFESPTYGTPDEYLLDARHELLHVLGRYHEHNRQDRDQYIQIQWDNIIPELWVEYRKSNKSTDQGVPYDYGSIMHYAPTTYSSNGEPAFVALQNSTVSIGTTYTYTYYDYLHVNLLYCQATVLMIKGFTISTMADTVAVRWTKPEFVPMSYNLSISCKDSSKSVNYLQESVTIASSETQNTITNLHPGSTCELTFFAVYNPASLDDGLSQTIYTKEQGSTTPPAGIRVVSVQATSIELDWEGLNDSWVIYSYHVKICSRSNCTVYDIINTGSNTFKATNLEPATEYSISLATEDMNGDQEPYTPPFQVTTLPKVELTSEK